MSSRFADLIPPDPFNSVDTLPDGRRVIRRREHDPADPIDRIIWARNAHASWLAQLLLDLRPAKLDRMFAAVSALNADDEGYDESLDLFAAYLAEHYFDRPGSTLAIRSRDEWLAMFRAVGYTIDGYRLGLLRKHWDDPRMLPQARREPIRGTTRLYRAAKPAYKDGLTWTVDYDFATSHRRYMMERKQKRPGSEARPGTPHIYAVDAPAEWILAEYYQPLHTCAALEVILDLPADAVIEDITPAKLLET